jgi:hypothetical protein
MQASFGFGGLRDPALSVLVASNFFSVGVSASSAVGDMAVRIAITDMEDIFISTSFSSKH